MKRATLLGLLTWAAFAAVYYALLRGRMPYAPAAAIGAALFMATVIGTYRTALWKLGDAKRLSGAVAPADGATIGVTGRIRTTAPLKAPFTKRPAALYVYDVEHDEADTDGEKRTFKDYSGLAMAPLQVESPFGAIGLNAFPLIEGVPALREKSGALQKAAESFVKATEFEDLTGFKFRATFDAVRHLVADEMDRVRKDWRLTNVGVTGDSRVVEKVVEPGATVCLLGRYSAQQNAIGIDNGVAPRLVFGSPGTAASTLRWEARQMTFVATVIALAVNGAVSLAFVLPHGATVATVAAAKKTSFDDMYKYHEAIRHGDLAAAQEMAAHGIPVNVADAEGKTPLAIAGNEATAQWLIANGADVNAADEKGVTVLMEQATFGHAGIIKLLIAKGARLDTVDPQYQMSALQYAEQYEYGEVVKILRDAGARDDKVTEKNGAALHEDDEPVRVALAYLDAVFGSDRDKVGSFWIGSKTRFFDDIDLKTYQGARPHPAHLLAGFANENAATLELRGPMSGGTNVTWRYDLTREDGKWKLRDELWETKLNGVR